MLRLRVLVALFLVAAGVRLVYVAAAGTSQDMPGLTRKYEACATHVRAGDGFVLGLRPFVPYVDRVPGYVLLLAGLQALVGTGTVALAAAHGLLGALQAPLAAAVGARVARPAAGVAAGLLVALLPPLVRSDTQLLETGIAGVVLVAALLSAVALASRPSAASALVLAVLGTAAVALRADYLLVPLTLALAVGVQPALKGQRLLLVPVLLLPLVVLVPWALRNARVADGAFVSVGLGTNLLAALGESVVAEGPLFGDQLVAQHEGHDGLYWPDPKRRDDERVQRALGLIARHPGGYLLGCLRRVPVLLSLHPGDLWPGLASARDHVREWRAAHPGRARYEGLARAALSYTCEHPLAALVTLGWGPLVMMAAALGAWALRHRWREALLLLAVPAYGLAVHLPLHAEPRYFLPFVATLAVLAGRGLVGGAAETRLPRPPLTAPPGASRDHGATGPHLLA